MSKRAKIVLGIGIVVVLLVAITSPRIRHFFAGSGGAAQGTPPDARLSVEAVAVRPEPVRNRVITTGTVIANEEVELRSEVSGTVREILFAEGRRVRKGDLLVRIDDSELRAQLLKAESQQNLAQDKEQRRRLLYEKQNISAEDYDVALNELNAIKAEVQLIQAKIDKTMLRAPFDGVVGLRSISEGSYVTPAIRIATLQDKRRVKIDFSVPEKYAPAVQTGQIVRFRLSGLNDLFEGKVYAIEPKIDPGTRSLLLRAVSSNEQGRIVPGAFAELELVVEEVPDALMIPTQALVPDLGGQKVFVYRSGIAQEQRVEVGIRTDTKIQITQGLQPLDTVITSGILQVVPGAPLTLVTVD